MATLNETINQVQNVFNDIESALQEQGVDTSNMKPVDYANAVRGIVNNITVENVSFLPVMIFCYSPTVPAKPVGGNWVQNEYTNQITPPDGWYLDLNNIEDASIGQDNIYMSVCIFKHDNTKYLDWTTPVRISGKDGKDGKTGKQGPAGNIAGVVIEYNTPLYAVTSASQAPDKPNCIYDVQNNSLSVNSEGWSLDTPDENSLGANILWQSIARYYSDKQAVICSNPVRISAGNPDIFRENGFYTEYCITKEINGAKTEWFTPASADPPVPTLSSPFLWARDVMSTTVTGKHVGPVYLFATYSAGLIGIDVSYTCAPSRDALNVLDESLWFNDSESALTPDATKEYQGLTEDTKYLWAREQFLYSNKEPDIQYRIVSTFTAAEKAAIVYSAGTFNEKVKYTRTEEQTPYVFFVDGVTLDENNKYSDSGKKYYYFVLKYSYDDDLYKIIPTNNTYPSIKDLYISSTASNKKCNWEKMESFDAIYSDIGVFKAANVGKFVFDDKYIFSQFGVDKDDKQEYNYTKYIDYSIGINNSEVKRKGVALAIETGQFIPNILLNAVTGEAKFGGGTNVLHSDGSFELANGNLQWKNNVLTVEGHVTAESFETKSSELETSISNLDNSLNSRITSASATWADNLSEYQTTTGETISQLNLRLDGAVSNYYKEGIPVTTEAELNELFNDESWYKHIGDTWTNVNDYNNGDGDPNGGKSWRWCEWIEGKTNDSPIYGNDNKKYHWHIITDNDASRALAEAGKAISVASAKTTTFINDNPQGASEGDLWIVPESYTGGDYIIGKTYVYKDGWKPVTDPSILDMSDFDAIRNAFKSGGSGFEGGLIFGEALGVFDQKGTEETSDDSLIGVLNGNPKYSDEKGHTIILAAGMNDSEPDVKAKIQNAKTMLCDNGDLKLGDALQFDAETSTLRVGDKIEIGTEDKCITVSETYYEYIYPDPSKNPITHYGKIEIGKDYHPTFQAYYNMKHTDKYDNHYDQHSSFSINMDGRQGCYGGGICKIDFRDNNLSVPVVSSSCIDTHLPGVPAMTVDSNTISICNLAGGISGLRTFAKSIGKTETLDYSGSSASFCPQTLVIHSGATCNFYLPKNQNSQIGDTFELWLGNSGTVYIHGAFDEENFFINADKDTWEKKTSHKWTTPGVYKCLFNGDNWWIKWI